MRRLYCLTTLCLVGACTGRELSETGPSIETGWFADTASPENCPGTVVDVAPSVGTSQWYWRDMPQIWTGSNRQETYSATLWEGATQIESQLMWAESGLTFSVAKDGPFAPDTDYQLDVTDCRETHHIPFRTSSMGRPFEGEYAAVEGKTFLIDLAGATWLEPGGFSAILSLYFTTPILLMVNYADAQHVDFLGAQGYRDDWGLYHQLPTEPTFDFPLAAWPEKPFFKVGSPQVDISVQGVPISIYDFSLNGTFASDLTKIGGAKVQGVGDTRHMGGLIGKDDDPAAICEQAALLGVACSECPDGLPYCMFLSAVDVDGTQVPGLQLFSQD